ncbi:MAG: tRNA (adenosine(37)-N6)-threonylcarbamoyltransferase complex transferase subunit TsaD [Oligoflexales bacterium]
MKILGIESSCDETAIAVVEDGRHVIVSLVASQTDIHAQFGGVVPEIAARQHLETIDALSDAALRKASLTMEDIDALAVTRGPGLVGSLVVGIAYAKGLALGSGKPLIPVDHVKAHVHGAVLGLSEGKPEFPCLAIVVSGGHTNIFAMKDFTSYELLAYSIDDACGECFDKVAKLLGLPYPGGPQIEKKALAGDPKAIPMPTIMAKKSDLRFSYSGLKTFIVNFLRKERANGDLSETMAANLCAAFQDEALMQIVRKLKSALVVKPKTQSIVVCGGVSANQRFRTLMRENIGLPTYFPALAYCSDNAAMIAAYGHHLFKAEKNGTIFKTDDWDAYSRFQFS